MSFHTLHLIPQDVATNSSEPPQITWKVPMDIPESNEPKKRQRRYIHSAEEWLAQKERITNLLKSYKLRDVVSIMDSGHGFKASLRSYNTKLKEWGLQSYVKASDMKIMLSKVQQRERDLHKRTRISQNGERWDQERLERFANRPENRGAEMPSPSAATPQGISYDTPSSIARSRTPTPSATSASLNEFVIVRSETDIPPGSVSGSLVWENLTRFERLAAAGIQSFIEPCSINLPTLSIQECLDLIVSSERSLWVRRGLSEIQKTQSSNEKHLDSLDTFQLSHYQKTQIISSEWKLILPPGCYFRFTLPGVSLLHLKIATMLLLEENVFQRLPSDFDYSRGFKLPCLSIKIEIAYSKTLFFKGVILKESKIVSSPNMVPFQGPLEPLDLKYSSWREAVFDETATSSNYDKFTTSEIDFCTLRKLRYKQMQNLTPQPDLLAEGSCGDYNIQILYHGLGIGVELEGAAVHAFAERFRQVVLWLKRECNNINMQKDAPNDFFTSEPGPQYFAETPHINADLMDTQYDIDWQSSLW